MKNLNGNCYTLTLFVAGTGKSSTIARRNLECIFREELKIDYALRIVDVLETPQAAVANGVVLAPSLLLVEANSRPVLIVGDLSDTARINTALGLSSPIQTNPGASRQDEVTLALQHGQVDAVVGLNGIYLVQSSELEEKRRHSETELRNIVDNQHEIIRDNNRLLQALSTKLSELSYQTLQCIENERKIIARELHDSIGASLTAIKFGLESRLLKMDQPPEPDVISFEQLIDYLKDASRETKRISDGLRPSWLDERNLLEAVQQHIEQFREYHAHIEVQTQIDVEATSLTPRFKIVLFRVLQEALNNIVKHSQADRVEIFLRRNGNCIELQVKDNGCGFEAEKGSEKQGRPAGFGLISMRGRVELCSGCFEICSKPGQGTTISVALPLEQING
ncbi:MAG: ATP-binding protein [Thermodesulfobacteriota bacterium]